MARYGGIDLGGTKIQAVVVDEAHEVLGASRAARPRRRAARPTSTLAMVGAHARRGRAGRRRARRAGRGRRRLARRAVDDEAGTVTSARNLPDWEGTYPLAEKLEARARRADRALQRRQRRHRGRVRARRGEAVPLAARRVLGHGRRRRHRPRRRAVGGPRRRRRDRPHGGQERRRARARAAGSAAWRPTPAAARWRPARARRSSDGEKTVLFEIMEERGKPRLSSGIWPRALERDDKLAHAPDRPRGRARSASPSRRRSTCSTSRPSIIGGGLGLRLGEPVRREDPRGDDAAPVRRPPPAGDPARVARRPRRGDRRDAARGRQGARARLSASRRTATAAWSQARRVQNVARAIGVSRAAARGGRARPRRAIRRLQPAVSGVGAAVAHDRPSVARVDDPVLRAGQHRRDVTPAGTGPRGRDRRRRSPRNARARVDAQDGARRRQVRPRGDRRVVGGERAAGRVAGDDEPRRGGASSSSSAGRTPAVRVPEHLRRRLGDTTADSAGRRPRCPRARGARPTGRRTRGSVAPQPCEEAARAGSGGLARRRGRITVTRPGALAAGRVDQVAAR